MNLASYAKAAVRAAGRAYLLDRYVRSAERSNRVRACSFDGASRIKGSYVVSTEKGVFLIRDGRLAQIFPHRTYGIALHDDVLYLSSVRGAHNSLFKARLPVSLDRLAPGTRLRFREIFHLEAPINERIHQICVHREHLTVSKTSENAIALIGLASDQEELVVRPFVDRFGESVGGDHNHVNSVFSCGEVLLFGAYRAGGHALIGAYQDGRIVGYQARNKGLHGVYVSGRDLYYGDTFGSEGKGYLIVNQGRFDEEYFRAGEGFCVRGVCRSGGEMLIGHSHKGPRAKRFEGPACLLVCRGEHVTECIEMPFAAIYDIMSTDGKYFEQGPAVTTWDEVNRLLTSVLGDPIYEHAIPGESSGE